MFLASCQKKALWHSHRLRFRLHRSVREADRSRNAFFWQDAKNKWSCRSQDGRYYYGFRSLRALLKSYVGGLLCEKSLCYSAKNARAKYWFSQNPRRVTCCVTMRCTGFFPPCFSKGGMKL